MRWALERGRLIERQHLEAQAAVILNRCQYCQTDLVPVLVNGAELLGCPFRNDGKHTTGAIPRIDGPLSVAPSSKIVAINQMLHEQASQRAQDTAIAELEVKKKAANERLVLQQRFTGKLCPPAVVEATTAPILPPPPPDLSPSKEPSDVWSKLLCSEPPTEKVPAIHMRARVIARLRLSGEKE